MKIFNIMLSRDLGGVQQAFLDYDTSLKNNGCEVINIVSMNARILSKISSTSEVRCLPNFSPWCIVSKIYLRIMIYLLKPDAIIVHGGRAINFARFLKDKKIPLIGIAHSYSYKRLKYCDYVIVLTEDLQEYMVSSGFNKEKLSLIPNMIKIDKPYFSKNLPSKEIITIGSFGRFVKKKGFNYLIRAIHILKTEGRNVNLILGGSGEEENNLQRLVNELNMTQDITFVGWVEDKESFFNSIDIFCLPSLHEPFGIILLEAMHNSVPIIATMGEGPSEILDKQYGLMCEKMSAKEMASQISKFLDSPNIAEEMASSAYLRVKQRYDISAVGKKLYNFIKSCI